MELRLLLDGVALVVDHVFLTGWSIIALATWSPARPQISRHLVVAFAIGHERPEVYCWAIS